jgi:hypothetical protein
VAAHGFAYSATTQKGDCGALLFLVNKQVQGGKIIGFHIAGNNNHQLGFSQSLCREDLEEFLKEDYTHNTDVSSDIVCDEAITYQNGNIVSTGNIFHSVYSRSRLRKSKLHPDHTGIGESKEIPAKLTPFQVGKEIIDPYKVAMEAYERPVNYAPDEKLLEVAAIEVMNFIVPKMNKHKFRNFDFKECVVGVEDIPTFRSLTRGTSSGYPLKCKGVTKKTIFGSDQTYTFDSPQAIKLRREFDNIESDARKGVRHLHVFTDNLKDETRPIEKVMVGKTRLFCGAPLCYTLLVRKYFGAFMAFYQKENINIGSAIGLNPFGDDWDYLVRKMASVAGGFDVERFGAGDYSRYDASEVSQIHWKIFDIINQVYNDNGMQEDEIVRRTLWLELVNSRHIVGDKIVEWNKSLPSGHPLTAIVNTIYGHIAFNYAFLRMQQDMGSFQYSFYDEVFLMGMGDDNVFACSSRVAEFFGEKTIAQYVGEINLTYTSDVKTEAKSGLRYLNQITFLKRSFKKEFNTGWSHIEGRYVAPIELDTIYEMMYWNSESTMDLDAITIANVETALVELSLHGKVVFEINKIKILEMIRASLLSDREIKYTSYASARMRVADCHMAY